jgi:hypothetical protein
MTKNIETIDKMITDKSTGFEKNNKDVIALLVLRADLIGESIIKDVVSILESKLAAMKTDNKTQFDQILIEIRTVQSNQKVAKDNATDLRRDLGYNNGDK